MKKPTKAELQPVMEGLLKLCSQEEIAVVVDKTQNTVWCWLVGRRMPDAANFYVLKELLEQRSKQ